MSEERHNKKADNEMEHEQMYLAHVHILQTVVDVARDHQHLLTGTTGLPIPKGRSHVHRICLKTSYDPKYGPAHWHQTDLTTGPAIEINCDEHTHAFEGETDFAVGHSHCLCSVTDSSPEEEYEEEEDYDNCHCNRSE